MAFTFSTYLAKAFSAVGSSVEKNELQVKSNIMIHKTQFQIGQDNASMSIQRTFASSLPNVWRAWTDAALLEKWWAPKPWKAVTEKMDFREGGCWHYYMAGPDGEKIWARIDYKEIDAEKRFEAVDCFADEQGRDTKEMPSMYWVNRFTPTGDGVEVDIHIQFDSPEDLQKIVELGFKEGFTMAHDNLDELLATL
jgi:uncharacterized protein YndB with AHSA1/START domain